MKLNRTLASSTTLEGLEKLINEYFYSIGYRCKEDGSIYRLPDIQLIGFKWTKKNKRFQFVKVGI